MNPTDVDRILADFRAWLEQLPSEALEPPAPSDETLDVATILRHYVALRQEVNLLTRASRAQKEQGGLVLDQLAETQRLLKARSEAPMPSPGGDATLPLLKALVETRDALALAQAQLARSRDALADPPAVPHPAHADSDQPPTVSLTLSGWARLFGVERSVRQAIAPLETWAAARARPASTGPSPREVARGAVDSLAAGYAMSLQRLDRALEQHGLRPIACVGEPFDPETMEVVDVVREPGRTGTEVIEAIRPGYRLGDRLFRCAHVRVARS